MRTLVNCFQGKSIENYVYLSEALRNFKHDQRGVTAVEYAIVAAGVAAVVSVVFGTDGSVSKMLNGVFTSIGESVQKSVAKG